MPLNEREIRDLEDRFEKLDEKLKTTFVEVEKRIEDSKKEPLDLMDRIQEMEDLILLMQLEITKLKDRTSLSTEFLSPDSPGVMERLNRIEEAVSLREEKKEEPAEGNEKLFEEETYEPQAGKEKGKSLLEEVQKILSS
jgi:hypothetical protein